jgi:hypothetical protein
MALRRTLHDQAETFRHSRRSAGQDRARTTAAVHRDLVAYAEVLGRETGQSVADPAKLIAPMLARFMATDRAFSRARQGLKGS